MDQDYRVLGHIPARNGTTQTLRNRTSMTISRNQRPHRIPVGHSQSPNTKIATHRPTRPVTLSSQETSMMTSPPGKTESNQARARWVKIQRVLNYPSQSTTLTFVQTRAVKDLIPQTTSRYQMYETKTTRSIPSTSSTIPTIWTYTYNTESQVVWWSLKSPTPATSTTITNSQG